MHHPQFNDMHLAVIDDNALACLGLQQLLEDIIPNADIMVRHSINDIDDSTLHNCAHYFVAANIYFANQVFFQERARKTIVLVNGEVTIKGMRTLNVAQNEKDLVRDIFAMHRVGHKATANTEHTQNVLSAREIEVIIQLCRGCINKEIADNLNISTTTVITHRKNIMSKLNARSLADVIIYALLNGYINIGEL